MLNKNSILKIVMNAIDIPEGSIVTKKTGEKRYTLKNKIRVYTDGVKLENKIELDIEGCFIVDTIGNINQINPDSQLAWEVTIQELRELIEEIYEGEYQ